MCISNSSITSLLCNDALETVEPEITIGSNCATGVIIPVRPTLNSTSNNFVANSSSGNLKAVAQRGLCVTYFFLKFIRIYFYYYSIDFIR